MKNKMLLIGAFGVSMLAISSVLATTEADRAIVASKAYVDARDNTKQDKITAQTTGNVVTYNGTNASGQTVFSERGIYNGAATYTASDADKLVTAGVVHDFAATVETLTVPDDKLVCYDTGTCSLWQISEGTTQLAPAGTFNPLTSSGM